MVNRYPCIQKNTQKTACGIRTLHILHTLVVLKRYIIMSHADCNQYCSKTVPTLIQFILTVVSELTHS